MVETNFKNWLFGRSLHNPEILYSLYKTLDRKQSNEHFEISGKETGYHIVEKGNSQELFLDQKGLHGLMQYLKDNYCSGQDIESWYINKTALTNRSEPTTQFPSPVYKADVNHAGSHAVHPKEKIYAALMAVISIVFWLLFVLLIVKIGSAKIKQVAILVGFYAGVILLAILLKKGFLIGILRGNAIRVTEKQFPSIYKTTAQIAQHFNISVPDVYILESGGILNAFATKFLGNNFIVLYSDIVEAAALKGNKALSFILGHELAHIKQKHLLKKVLLFPGYFVPFLGFAYSRACEYTCDKMGYLVSSPEAAQHGLLLLAGGKSLYNQINVQEYLANYRICSGFWTWFTEKFLTHPFLTKRLDKLFLL